MNVKNLVLLLLATTTVVFGALYLNQRLLNTQTQARLTEVEAGLKQQQENEASNAARREKQTRELLRNRLSNPAANPASQPSQPEPALSAAPTNTEAKGTKGFFEMLKTPEMRELVRSQQKAFMGGFIDQSYGAFFKQLNLTPEQTATLKNLIEKKSLVAADMGMSMLDGDLDATKRKELAQQVKESNEATDAEIKQFLGDENYAQFQAYEKTQPERMQMSQLKSQLAGAGAPLSSEQETQLIQALSEERQNFKFTTDYNDQSKFTGDFAEYFTDEKLNSFSQEKAQLDERSLVRAREILTAEQFASYEKFLTAQREMQLSAMRMAAKMFAPKDAAK
ncbi:MAG: hypothetical protein HY298_02765 [Verrucomicrobia bacterium]|nr:hypothetical protein [Verrucomicrobiota bacterium]